MSAYLTEATAARTASTKYQKLARHFADEAGAEVVPSLGEGLGAEVVPSLGEGLGAEVVPSLREGPGASSLADESRHEAGAIPKVLPT